MAIIQAMLVLDGIKGEAEDSALTGGVELIAFDWSGSAAGADSPTAGRVRLNDVTVLKYVDLASTGLWLAMLSRKPINTAVFYFRKSAGTPGSGLMTYLKLTLSDVYVVGIKWETDAENRGVVKERVTFNFSKADADYTQQNDQGGNQSVSSFSYQIPR